MTIPKKILVVALLIIIIGAGAYFVSKKFSPGNESSNETQQVEESRASGESPLAVRVARAK
ncbi:MAG: hypothetical protein ACOC57_03900, partial [Acidobacteriota bacterium]